MVLQVSVKTRILNVLGLVWENCVIIQNTALIAKSVVLEYVRTDVLHVTVITTASQVKFVVSVDTAMAIEVIVLNRV